MKLRKQFNKKYKGTPWKGKPGKSLTVPDQNLTIGELLDRHSRGVSLGATDLKGEYFDTEIPRYDDLTDMLEHKKSLIQQQLDLEKQIKEEQKQATPSSVRDKTLKEKPEVEDSEAEEKA
tara:strand:- start:94 stop:453 length:360 start_codon:yes stop_codon:yes gene_type:complete